MLKYWQKVRVKSWFYEGMEGALVSIVDTPLSTLAEVFYNIRIPALQEESNLIIEHVDNLEIIL